MYYNKNTNDDNLPRTLNMINECFNEFHAKNNCIKTQEMIRLKMCDVIYKLNGNYSLFMPNISFLLN